MAVLGAGGSGYAAATLATLRGARVSAFDSGDPGKLADAVERFAGIGVKLVCGEAALEPPRQFDLTVISPGIDAGWPIGQAFTVASDELIGEIEFAFRLSKVPVIAITGTNGKTTTTELVATMLKDAGLRAVAAGNIGLAYSEVVASGEDYDWIVLEVSSFQLETVSRFAPRVAVWLNFAPDHMDRYVTVADYRAAKLRLFENHPGDASAICKREEELGLPNSTTFSAFVNDGDFSYREGKIIHGSSSRSFDFSSCRLHGRHNAENVMVALAVADVLGISWETIRSSIEEFRAPAHRCEVVAEIGGVLYVNDSKSTNLHSLESALQGQEQPVVLIAGGKEKGLDFSALRGLVSQTVKAAVCIGEIAERVAEAWRDAVPCRVADSVAEAVSQASDAAGEGDVVLFSPGTSSFDMFSGYEERGNAFRAAVLDLVPA